MGALLVTALVEEDSFNVRSIAHSHNTRIAMERTAEVEWECQALYYGKVCTSFSAVLINLTIISLTTSRARAKTSMLTSWSVE
jgi:hypothetical protein